jgi:ubiquitin C-terminal hydrolase
MERIMARVADNAWRLRMRQKGQSLFTRRFFGQLRKITTCSRCGHTRVRFPTFLYLQLPLDRLPPDGEAPVRLEDLIAVMASQHADPSGARCQHERCTGSIHETREGGEWRTVVEMGRLLLQQSVWRCPSVLMLRVARAATDRRAQPGQKLTAPVSFPLELSVRHGAALSSRRARLALRAVLMHEGASVERGHHYAMVRAAPEQWFVVDDDTVERRNVEGAEPGRMAYADAYVLMYEESVGQVDVAQKQQPADGGPA